MILRYRLSPYGKSKVSFIEKQKDARAFLYRVEDMINRKIEVRFVISYSSPAIHSFRSVRSMVAI